jgi:adenylate cyclase
MKEIPGDATWDLGAVVRSPEKRPEFGTGAGPLATRAYRHLGPRYPKAAIAFGLFLFYVVYLFGGTAIVPAFFEVSWGEFALLAGFIVLEQTIYNLFFGRAFRRRLRPVVTWMEAGRPRDQALEAWRAAVSLPTEYLRLLVRYVAPFWGALAFAIVAAVVLELSLLEGLILLLAAELFIWYAVVLFYLTMELAMRPVAEDAACLVEEGVALSYQGVPIRWRLLTALPVINLITGLVIAGLADPGREGIEDLDPLVLGALTASFGASLWLTALLAGSVAAPIAALRDATERLGAGDLSTRVPVATTDETGALTRSFNAMAIGLEERERLRDAFGTFVDPELAERVLEEGTDLAGDEVEASMLFLDVREFTRMSENSSAREIVGKLNELYDLCVPVVIDHGGHANKFIGDGMLAVFGAPDRHRDHADRAVAAAIEIAHCVRKHFRGEVEVGIGVNSGRVLVGTVGGGGRLDFTVIGDAVNTASRVESATRETGDDVLVTEATLDLLSGERDGWQERPPITFKGKSARVRLYAPAGGRGDGVEAAGSATSD